MFGFKRRLRAFLAWFKPKPDLQPAIEHGPNLSWAQAIREVRIEILIQDRHVLRCRIDGLRKSKKKHSHLTDKLVELTNRQMEMEAQVYGPAT